MSVPLTKAAILKNLKIIYWRALNAGNFHIALRAIELQAKHIGLFEKQTFPKVLRIADMTEEQLVEFIDRLEKQEPDLKDQEENPKEEKFPTKEPEIMNANPERTNSQGEPNPAVASVTRHTTTKRQETPKGEPTYIPYPEGKNSAKESVLDAPHPGWEKPPPFADTASLGRIIN